MKDERTDEGVDGRVDALLADLDRALSIEPSPSVAARVRTRVEAGASGWFGWRWSLTAAGLIVLAGTAYLVWPRPSAVPSSSFPIASTAPAASGSQPPAQAQAPAGAPAGVPALEPAMRHAGARTTAPTPVRHTTVDIREPEVLVSPNQRIALEQLAAALKDGRLTAESVAAAHQPIVHEPLVVPPMVIEPFKTDVLPAIGSSESIGSGGGVIRRVLGFVAH